MIASDSGPIRIAALDTDTGFLQVLTKRADGLGWPQRTLGAPPRAEELAAMRVDALVLDIALLGPDAWSFLAEVAAAAPTMGIVVATGPSSVAQRVRGLRAGADDWIAKPCHPEEVLARVEAVVRRRRGARGGEGRAPVVAGELEIRADRFQAYAGGRSAELTRREFEVLALLADAQGRVLQREELYQRAWGYAMAHGDRSVDVFVRKLRQKLEAASPAWRYIHTHFGVGYRFDPEPVAGDEPPVTGAGEADAAGAAPATVPGGTPASARLGASSESDRCRRERGSG